MSASWSGYMGHPKRAGMLVLFLLTASCLHDSTGPDSLRYGRYTLRTVNGSALPGLMLESAAGRIEFLAGALRLNHDLSFTDSTELRVMPAQGAVVYSTDVAAGTFRFAGDTVLLSSSRGERYHMVFQVAGSLTQELNGRRLVYRK